MQTERLPCSPYGTPQLMPGLADFGVPAYGDWLEEARRCRSRCALFDFSFMSRARVRGVGAHRVLEQVQSRSLERLNPGGIRYGLCVDNHGVVRSDVTIWCLNRESFDVYTGDHADVERTRALSTAGVEVEDLTANTAVYAVQGPGTLDAMAAIADVEQLAQIAYFQHRKTSIAGVICHVGRLGYTGEKGFEIVPLIHADAGRLYTALAEQVQPAGLLAADMLRIEAGYLLFTNDCRLQCGTAALGLGKFDDAAQHSQGFRRIFFHVDEDLLLQPYAAPDVLDPPVPGTIAVTSATPSVSLSGTVGMGLMNSDDSPESLHATIFPRSSTLTPSERPFYDPDKLVVRGHWAR